MSKIEIFAAETTGVREEDEVIEWALGTYETGGAGLTKVEHRIVNPSGNLDWDPNAVVHHQKSGLLQELLDGKGETKIVIPFAATHMRLVWKMDFIKKYLPGYGQILDSARSADHVLRVAEVLRDTQFRPPIRALPKVEQIANALYLLEDPDS